MMRPFWLWFWFCLLLWGLLVACRLLVFPLLLRLRSIPGSAHCDKMIKFTTTMTFFPKAFHLLGRVFGTNNYPQAPPWLVECDLFLPPDLLLGFLTESICLLLTLIISRYCLESSSLWIVPLEILTMFNIVASVVSSFISFKRSSHTQVLLLWVRNKNFTTSSQLLKLHSFATHCRWL